MGYLKMRFLLFLKRKYESFIETNIAQIKTYKKELKKINKLLLSEKL